MGVDELKILVHHSQVASVLQLLTGHKYAVPSNHTYFVIFIEDQHVLIKAIGATRPRWLCRLFTYLYSFADPHFYVTPDQLDSTLKAMDTLKSTVLYTLNKVDANTYRITLFQSDPSPSD